MKIYQSLGFKLFLFIVIVLSFVTSILTYYNSKHQAQHYEKILEEWAFRTSTLVSFSLRKAMILNERAWMEYIISDLTGSESICDIRLFKHSGDFVFSGKGTNEINKLVKSDLACQPCHAENALKKSNPSAHTIKLIDCGGDSTRGIQFTTPILNENACSGSGCHVSVADDPVLGMLEINISLYETDQILKNELSGILTANISIAILLALSVGIIIWIYIHIPLTQVIKATRNISSGDLNFQIQHIPKNEIGLLARSFNKMTRDLKAAKEEITIWSQDLERRVQEKTEQLEQTQQQVMHIEKMASLGKLSATVAHELNNPMAGILTYSKLIQRKLANENLSAGNRDAVFQNLKMIESESDRLGKIIKDLLLFSKKQEPIFQDADITEIVRMSCQLIQHHLDLHGIHLELNLNPDLPHVKVDQNQIKQALLALYVNAVEAMENGGILNIKTDYSRPAQNVEIRISDNGHGIPREIVDNIFEPFFTTKNAVKGFGLGLSVVYGIITNHRGTIEVSSEVNKGTSFHIKLPIK